MWCFFRALWNSESVSIDSESKVNRLLEIKEINGHENTKQNGAVDQSEWKCAVCAAKLFSF